MRKIACWCLGCERVIYVERYEIGKTSCPRCGSTKVLPVAVVFRGNTLQKQNKKGGAR